MITAYEHTKKLIEDVTPALTYKGEDINSWKAEARKELAHLLGMDKFKNVPYDTVIEYKKEEEDYSEIRFTFQSEEGYRVPCHLLLPKGIKKPAVMICLQGHSKGMHISLGRPKYEGDENSIKGDRDFVIQAVREGYAAIAMEQRNFGECGGTSEGPDCYKESMNNIMLGKTTIGGRVWDVSRLIDVLEKDFSDMIDTKKIGCMGNSGGGTATAYLSALEDRISLAVVSCAMCTYKDSISAMFHCSCNFIPNIANYFEMNDLITMAFPKHYIQVSGTEDNIFPIEGAEYIYNKIKWAYSLNNEEGKCALIKGNGGHRFYAMDAWKKIKEFF